MLGGQYSTKDGRYKESIVTSIGDNIIGETVINMNATEDKVDGIIEFYDGHSLTAVLKIINRIQQIYMVQVYYQGTDC